MLQFYKNSQLTIPITSTSPKWVSVPATGGIKTDTVYLGDGYTTITTQPLIAGATSIPLIQVDELPSSGTIILDTDPVLASDNFHRPNENPINPAVWTTLDQPAGFQLVNNTVQPQQSQTCSAIYSGIMWPDDQYSEIVAVAEPTLGNIGVIVRGVPALSPGLGYSATCSGTLGSVVSVAISKLVPTNYITLASGTTSVVPGDVLRLEIVGGNLTFKVNGIIILTASDGTYSSGSAGIIAYSDPPALPSQIQGGAWQGGQILSDTVTYSGITSLSLTGCSGVLHAHEVGATVYPQITYSASGNISVLVAGMVSGPIGLSLSPPNGSFGPPGVPALYSTGTINSGASAALPVLLQFTAPPGVQAQYVGLSLNVVSMTRAGDLVSGYSTITVQPNAPISIQQRDQGLIQHVRVLPVNRQVQPTLPGFQWGSYRWRDNTTENAAAIIPTVWDINTSLISPYFIAGVGNMSEEQDLQPITIEEQDNSIYLRINKGQYFTGVNRYYLPSDNYNLQFFPCSTGQNPQYTLSVPPRQQIPIFVGTWQRNNQGFYEYLINARYVQSSAFEPVGTSPQYMINKVTGVLTINSVVQQPQQTLFLGLLTGGSYENFPFPVYPIESIVNLYAGNPTIPIVNFSPDYENGLVIFPKVPGTTSGQPVYAVVNPAIAIMYEFDSADTTQITNTNIPDEDVFLKDTRLLTSIDLNPAFSGLASGYVCLQQRDIEAASVVLSCDKPQIAVPATLSSIIGLVAYGPVFYNGDYALLSATAYGTIPNEVVPGIQLQVIPGGINQQPLQNAPFRGLINGQDPNTNTIIVITGSDGTANLVYQPNPDFGYYIPLSAPWVSTTNITNDTLLLPNPVPISQIWNASDSWLTYIYSVLSNNPLFGLSGGVPSQGQLPFMIDGEVNGDVTITHTSWTGGIATFTLASAPTELEVGQNVSVNGCNTPSLNGLSNVLTITETLGVWYITADTNTSGIGSEAETTASLTYSNFRTNGIFSVWETAGNPITPTFALDNNGNNYTQPAFNGKVVKLIFGSTLPNLTDPYLQAYFLQYLEREVIQLQVVNSNVVSNSIMLQMQTPQQIVSNPYLILSISGLSPSWSSGTVYTLNSEIEVSVGSPPIGYIMKATSISGTGTSGVSAPSWNTTTGSTTTDNPGGNQIVWTNQGPGIGYSAAYVSSRMNINRLGITSSGAIAANSTQQPS